jgi:hypothetical protein
LIGFRIKLFLLGCLRVALLFLGEYMEGIKNYRPGSMSFSDGFLGPKGNVGYFMKLDIEKAKDIILSKNIQDIEDVVAGLDGDWEVNSQTIYDGSEFLDYDLYDHSCWAKPIMIINYKNKPSEMYEIWKKDKKS